MTMTTICICCGQPIRAAGQTGAVRSARLAPKFKGYDDFSPAHTAAKRAACAELGLLWTLVPGASMPVRLPAAWVACKVFGRVSKSPRDVRMPAARVWPNGLLPIGPEYFEDYAREAPPRPQADEHVRSFFRDMMRPAVEFAEAA
jgi:hypothetical protein